MCHARSCSLSAIQAPYMVIPIPATTNLITATTPKCQNPLVPCHHLGSVIPSLALSVACQAIHAMCITDAQSHNPSMPKPSLVPYLLPPLPLPLPSPSLSPPLLPLPLPSPFLADWCMSVAIFAKASYVLSVNSLNNVKYPQCCKF